MEQALILKPSVSVLPYNQSPKAIAAQNKFNEKVFRDCQKNVTKAEVRDADWGLYAAQTCLAKDLVTASPEEAKLITAKMSFIQNIINQNMEMDENHYVQDESQKRELIATKADAKAKVLPARAAAIAGTINATTGVLDSASNLVVKSGDLVKTVKDPVKKLDLSA